jgi:hypothetical protein
MSANRPRLGVDHRTVVPTNFERSEEPDPDEEVEVDLEPGLDADGGFGSRADD